MSVKEAIIYTKEGKKIFSLPADKIIPALDSTFNSAHRIYNGASLMAVIPPEMIVFLSTGEHKEYESWLEKKVVDITDLLIQKTKDAV